MAKKVVIALTAGVTSALVIAQMLRSRQKKIEKTRTLATIALHEERYRDALSHFQHIQNPTSKEMIQMAQTHEALGNLLESATLASRCIAEDPTTELAEMCERLYTALGFPQMALRYIFIQNLLNNRNKSTEDFTWSLKAISSVEALRHTPRQPPSPISYADFFETLLFLGRVEDPVTAFIQSSEYSKCWDLIQESDVPLHRLIRGAMEYCNGYPCKAIETLSTLDSEIAEVLIFYIQIRQLRQNRMSKQICSKSKCYSRSSEADELEVEKISRFENSSDPTVQYYIARIYECLEDPSKQMHHLERGLEITRSYPAVSSKIIWLIQHGKRTEALELIRSAITEFPEKLNLFCIAIELLLSLKMFSEAAELLRNMELVDPTDPRTHLFKYIAGRALGNPKEEHLVAAVEADPLYFKTYIYLANHNMDTPSSQSACAKALEHAHGFDEAFVAYQLSIFLETYSAVKKDHPSLFTT